MSLLDDMLTEEEIEEFDLRLQVIDLEFEVLLMTQLLKKVRNES